MLKSLEKLKTVQLYIVETSVQTIHTTESSVCPRENDWTINKTAARQST